MSLPQELIDAIIDHLGSNSRREQSDHDRAHEALLNCCLVSRSFWHRSRAYTFEEITIGTILLPDGPLDATQRRIQRFLTLLESRSGIASYVRSLRLVVQQTGPAHAIFNNPNILKIIQYLPDIERLTLIKVPVLIIWSTVEVGFRSAIRDLCRRPSIKSLTIQGFANFPISYVLRCPNLETLVVHKTLFFSDNSIAHSPGYPQAPPGLRTLDAYQSPSFLFYLFKQGAQNVVMSKLMSLKVGFSTAQLEQDIAVLRALKTSAGSLKHLTLCEVRVRAASDSSHGEALVLPSLPHLASLKVTVHRELRQRDSCPIDVRDLLRPTQPSLNRLHLHFTWYYPETGESDDTFISGCLTGSAGWDDLNEIVSSGTRYPNLRFVEVNIALIFRREALVGDVERTHAEVCKRLGEIILLPKLQEVGEVAVKVWVDSNYSISLAEFD